MNEVLYSLLLFGIAAGASLLTFFSGFGLGTLLLPVFLLRFGPETALLLTGLVHLSNNMLKLKLLYKNIQRKVLLQFGIPSLLAAIAGVYVLRLLGELPPWWGSISPLKFIIGLLILLFAGIEWLPTFQWGGSNKALIPGALLSGFFGGLSGHQGALRSAFLVKLNLGKEAFIATGTAIACVVDLGRIPLYLQTENALTTLEQHWTWLLLALAGAMGGAFLGNRLLKKVTLHTVKIAVSIGMGLIGIGMMLGKI